MPDEVDDTDETDDSDSDEAFDDGWYEPPWESDARGAISAAMEAVRFDEEEGAVYVPTGEDPQGGTQIEKFTDIEQLRFALIELGEVQMSANAPYDGGPVFTLDASSMVEDALASKDIYDFFELRRAPPEDADEIITLDQLTSNTEQAQADVAQVSQELIRWLAKHPEKLYELAPRKFEELVAELFKDMGYAVELTAQTRDGGRDILALHKSPVGSILTLIECKRFSRAHKVDVGIVRQLYGVVEADRASHGVIATTSFFTPDAQRFVKAKQLNYRLSLKNYDNLIDWISAYKGRR